MHRFLRCRFVIAGLVALAATAAAAQQTSGPSPSATTPPPIKDPKAFAADFLALMEKNEAEAYDSLKSTGLNPGGIDSLKQTAARLTASIGPVRGSELLDETHLGKRVMRLVLVVLHQRGPVVQTLTYYMPPGGTDWRLIAIDMTGEPGRFPFPPDK